MGNDRNNQIRKWYKVLANIYIHADAIKYNGIDSKEEFLSKFSLLLNDLIEIRNQFGKDNVIKVSPNLSMVKIYQDNSIYEVASSLEPEERNFIYFLLGNTSEETSVVLDDLLLLCRYDEKEEVCNSIVYLNVPSEKEQQVKNESAIIDYITFDKYEIIYGKDSWHTFRRQIIGNHPGNAHEFMLECSIHFSNIVFHPNCESSIVSYLDKIPRKIVYYLSCMNDKLLEQRSETGITDENALLADFCGKYRFDEAGTRQSTPGKKELYQFKFLKLGCNDVPENYKTITCDPHMKISSCDKNCKNPSNDFVARIYFHFGDNEIAPGKLLVGSIGPHL